MSPGDPHSPGSRGLSCPTTRENGACCLPEPTMRSRAWRLCRQDPAGRHPEGKEGVGYCPGLAQRRHVHVYLTTRPRWGPQSWAYPGLSQGHPCWAGQRTPASGCSPGRMARGPHSAMATRTETALVTSPARPCPSGVGKASADSGCSHRPNRRQAGVTQALGSSRLAGPGGRAGARPRLTC